MATIINNPDTGSRDSGGGAGIIIGVVVAIIILFVFFVYALPAMRGSKQDSGTTVNVPGKIDVNVNKGTN